MVTFGPTYPSFQCIYLIQCFWRASLCHLTRKIQKQPRTEPKRVHNVYITPYIWLIQDSILSHFNKFFNRKNNERLFFSQTTKCNSSHLTSFFKMKVVSTFCASECDRGSQVRLLIADCNCWSKAYIALFYRTLTSFLIVKTMSDCFFVKPQSVIRRI